MPEAMFQHTHERAPLSVQLCFLFVLIQTFKKANWKQKNCDSFISFLTQTLLTDLAIIVLYDSIR